MKQAFRRFGIITTALILGTVVFALFLFLGDRSRGPLDDLLTSVNSTVAHTEKTLLETRKSRSAALQWFNGFRNNANAVNTVDTLLLGAYDDRTTESYENIISLEDSLQAKFPIMSIYTAWGSKKFQAFPLLRAQAIYDLGSIPMITWEPWLDDFDPAVYTWNAKAANKNRGGLKAIAEGKYDRYIDEWVADAKTFGLPFFLRFAHEMNDPYRYPWGQQNNAPADFIAAWQHVVQRFRAAGVTNAIWVWSPHPAYLTFRDFYPGDDFVHWIGITTLNYGTVAQWSQWWSFSEIFRKCYDSLEHHPKPFMLTEFGSLAVGGNRAEWFSQAFESFSKDFTKVKAVVFFHASSDNTTTYKALDWSFENDPEVMREIRKAIKTE